MYCYKKCLIVTNKYNIRIICCTQLTTEAKTVLKSKIGIGKRNRHEKWVVTVIPSSLSLI